MILPIPLFTSIDLDWIYVFGRGQVYVFVGLREATRTGVHRLDESKVSREMGGALHTTNCDSRHQAVMTSGSCVPD